MSKKTETIEIRVSPELKAELAEKARAQGTTMSGYLRERIAGDDGVGSTPKAGGPEMSKTTKTLTRMGLATLPVAALASLYMIGGTAVVTANPDLRVTFAEMDLDGNGAITSQEYSAFMTGDVVFTDDAEIDGMVPEACKAEFAGAFKEGSAELQAEVAQAMRETDANGDGALSYEELEGVYMRDQAQSFLEMDTDEDGFVTEADLVAYFNDDSEIDGLFSAAMGEEDLPPLSAECEAALAAEDMAFEAQGDLPLGQSLAAEARMMVAEYDSNRDGRVSLTEFSAN